MKCPICLEGDLVDPTQNIPNWLEPPVKECSECGDLISLAGPFLFAVPLPAAGSAQPQQPHLRNK